MKPPGGRCSSPSGFIAGYHILTNLVGKVAPQALPDAYETTTFLFRSDWTLAASGSVRMKLHSFRQDLPANLKADFQQDLLD